MGFVLELLLHVCALLPFYLIGAIPVGYLVGKLHSVDVTKAGSGNVGATNVLRTVGRKAGMLTLAGDVLKGGLAPTLAAIVARDPVFTSAAAVAAVAGHCFSIPGKLRGGKGVATGLGALFYLDPHSAGIAVLVFIVVFGMGRVVSLASICAALSAPLTMLVADDAQAKTFAIGCIAVIIVYRHRENLSRIAAGKELKFSRSTRPVPAPRD